MRGTRELSGKVAGEQDLLSATSKRKPSQAQLHAFPALVSGPRLPLPSLAGQGPHHSSRGMSPREPLAQAQVVSLEFCQPLTGGCTAAPHKLWPGTGQEGPLPSSHGSHEASTSLTARNRENHRPISLMNINATILISNTYKEPQTTTGYPGTQS